MKGIEDKVYERIESLGVGSVFISQHFFDLDNRQAVNRALARLVKRGVIRRLARGLFDLPKTHPTIGVLFPSLDNLMKALSAKYGIRLQATGAYAANLLGLSNQVPAKVAFLTDGKSRVISFGNLKIYFYHTSLKNMMTAGTVSGLVIQALLHLGRPCVDDRVVNILRRRLNAEDKQRLLIDAVYAPAWVAAFLGKIASG